LIFSGLDFNPKSAICAPAKSFFVGHPVRASVSSVNNKVSYQCNDNGRSGVDAQKIGESPTRDTKPSTRLQYRMAARLRSSISYADKLRSIAAKEID
jgi:hypothetical protein